MLLWQILVALEDGCLGAFVEYKRCRWKVWSRGLFSGFGRLLLGLDKATLYSMTGMEKQRLEEKCSGAGIASYLDIDAVRYKM